MIKDKATMYKLLQSGRLGNTNKSWRDLEHFEGSGFCGPVGIRSLKPGGLCLYHVKAKEVSVKIALHWPNGGYKISEMMKDEDIKYQGEYRPWELYYSTAKLPMRDALAKSGKQLYGIHAMYQVLSGMNDKSRGMFEELLSEYPDHVIEFSVYGRNVGIMPGHNTIIWECRLY